MYADRTQSRACKAPISRRALAHLRAAAGLPRRPRGAQPGNRNRMTHGIHSRAFRARRERNRELLRQSQMLLALVSRHRLKATTAHCIEDELTQRQTHRATVRQPAPLFRGESFAKSFVEIAGSQFDKAVACVEGCIPRDMAKGRQRDAAKSARECGVARGVDQAPAKPAPLEIHNHRQFLDVQRIADDLGAQFANQARSGVISDPDRAGGDEVREFVRRADGFFGNPGQLRKRAKQSARGCLDGGQHRGVVRRGKSNGNAHTRLIAQLHPLGVENFSKTFGQRQISLFGGRNGGWQ